MLRQLCLAAISIAFCVPQLPAQVTLKLKFAENSSATSLTDVGTSQTLVLAGMNIETSTSTIIRSKRSVGERDAEGNIPVVEKVESMQFEMKLPGGLQVTFDSASPDKPAPIPQLDPTLDLLRKISQLPITTLINAKNQIVSVRLPDGESDKLSEEAKQHFSAEALKKSAEQAMEFLPDEPVKPGDKWERSSEVPLGAGQIFNFRTQFEYAGTTSNNGVTLDKITAKVIDVTYSINGNAGLQVTKSEMKVKDSEITYLFDREQGRLESKASKIRIAGDLTIVVNNNEASGTVDLTITEKMTRQP